MLRRDAILYALAGIGIALLVAAAVLYEPPPSSTPTAPGPAPTPPPLRVCTTPCLAETPLMMDAAEGHQVWRWDTDVSVSSLDIDGTTPVLGIAWTRGEDIALEAAVFFRNDVRTQPIFGFSPVPATRGDVFLRQEENATRWDWRDDTTTSLPGVTIPIAADGGRLLAVCGTVWCIDAGGGASQLPLPTDGHARPVGDLDDGVAYVAWVEGDDTVLYRVGATLEELARQDIVRVAAHGGNVAWVDVRGGATVLLADGTRHSLPDATNVAWADERLVYAERGTDAHITVKVFPSGAWLAHLSPQEDLQALGAEPGVAWLAGTMRDDATDVPILARVPLPEL